MKQLHLPTTLIEIACLYHSGSRIQKKDRVSVFLVALYDRFSVDSSVPGLSKVIYCVVSSAYRRREEDPAESLISFTKIFKKSGPGRLSCNTPQQRGSQSDTFPFHFTCWKWPDRYDWISFMASFKAMNAKVIVLPKRDLNSKLKIVSNDDW